MSSEGSRSVDFDDYVALHKRALLRFAAVLTVDPAAADDVVAEVLARAFENWAQVSKASSVHGYVRKMVLNEYLGSQRRSWRLTYRADVSDLTPRVADHAEAHADHVQLVHELRRLPPRQRAAVVLRYYEGLSFGEIAALLGTGENAIRSNVSRGLRTLKVRLTDDEDDHRSTPQMEAVR